MRTKKLQVNLRICAISPQSSPSARMKRAQPTSDIKTYVMAAHARFKNVLTQNEIVPHCLGMALLANVRIHNLHVSHHPGLLIANINQTVGALPLVVKVLHNGIIGPR